ncbi:hypothetical protein AAVH_04215 [Aphelenchoides avenae]|nr:hypothetical protein AAVH_04215 [Aphelenchus avenae]
MAASTARYVRYGTALLPAMSVKFCLPPWTEFRPVDPADTTLRPFDGLSPIKTKRFQRRSTYKTNYPSISTINGVTDDQKVLYNWQYRMVTQMGTPGFRAWMAERQEIGTSFHEIIDSILRELRKGNMKTSDEEVLRTAEEKKCRGYIESLLPIIRSLRPCSYMTMEAFTNHHALFYRGKMDAIIELEGEPTLVDWKTVTSRGKTPSEAAPETELSELYANPVQLAAYIGAVNSDPEFERYPIIRQGAVIRGFEDGRPGEIVMMREEQIEEYFEKFLHRLNYFWWHLEHREPSDSGLVSFVYNPVKERKLEPEEPLAEQPSTSVV